MHLKRLELFGFKTFADRTELEFLPGVTAVVGPNGSGKSNIADAIQWVLGEQSMRSLRSLSAQDVIFAGTQRRRPLGFAEASLTFDNETRSLPLDFDEVTITRRLYRSGESDYLINKVPCRLRDIHELFLDTGVGCDAYSIVGQGEIDAVLSVKSEDRRALVEEAAGIKKYRVRKREAIRKLEATQANLTRVHDIIAEIESQLPPLRDQAEVARQFRELRDRAQALERALLLTEYRRALQQVEEIRRTRALAEERVETIRAELARVESEAEAARFAVTRAESTLEEARAAASAASQKVERARGTLGVSRERLASVEAGEADDAERIADLERALERCRREKEEASERIAAAEAAERAATEELRRCEAEVAAIQGRMEKLARVVEEHRRQAVERARALTNAQADLRASGRQVQDARAALTRATQRLEMLGARAATQQAREEGLREKVTEAERRCEQVNEQLRRAEAERATLQRGIVLAGQRMTELRTEITARSTRLRTLRELDAKLEGYRDGARAILRARKEGRLKGHFVPIVDLLEVSPEFEAAIHAALGDDLDALVVDSLEEAYEAITYLRKEGKGRATFVVREAAVPVADGTEAQEILSRRATQHVRFADAHRNVIGAVLGNAVVVRHLEEAREVLALDHARYRAVTLEGDLLHPRGILTGGRANGGAASLLARRREMAGLEEETARLENELARVTKENETKSAALRAAEVSLRRQREEASRAASALAAAKKDLDYCAQEARRLADDLRRAEQSIHQAEADVEKAVAREARLRAHVEQLQTQDSGADADIESARASLEELNRERDRAAEAVADQKVAAARARQQVEGQRENAARAHRQEEETLRDIERRRAHMASRAERVRALREEIAGQEAELAQFVAAHELAQKELDERRAERRRLLEASGKIEQQAKEVRDRLAAAQHELHRAEVKLAGVEADIQHAQTSLYEQYGLTADALQQVSREGVPEIRNRQQAGQELRQLRAQMAELGEVNLGAVEEVERLEERLRFLTTQREDLTQAREGLLEVIAEIDSETRGRFMRTIEQLRQAFNEIFVRLFGGGTTAIRLTDESDVLEGGLEIVVQPPGKKPQSMLQLSGGERALTATAFLFALLRIKPSPFVLLDEVDAPLDELNVARYAAMLKEFAEKSQFIVITHNKGTMEAADVLYGVTMPEQGVSRIVSVRLEDIPEAA
ncbi:MAG TPA: chromosome segregation protein SMC [Armatimonadota bacterium]|nr:chromosome segregation protein SMC [Armatimonadota bacterium]